MDGLYYKISQLLLPLVLSSELSLVALRWFIGSQRYIKDIAAGLNGKSGEGCGILVTAAREIPSPCILLKSRFPRCPAFAGLRSAPHWLEHVGFV